MSRTTRAITGLKGAIASVGLLVLTATSSLASTHTQAKTPATASGTLNEQEQRSQPVAQQTPKAQQASKMGCSCCQNMMNSNMKGMNMPGMMEAPSQSR